jgi:hypothetical protein
MNGAVSLAAKKKVTEEFSVTLLSISMISVLSLRTNQPD